MQVILGKYGIRSAYALKPDRSFFLMKTLNFMCRRKGNVLTRSVFLLRIKKAENKMV